MYKKKSFWKKTFGIGGSKKKYVYLSNYKNYQKVNLNINPTIEYIKNKAIIIYKTFIDKVNKYLPKSIQLSQNLYDHLYTNYYY